MSPRPEQVPVARATEDSEFGEVADLERLAAAAPLGEEPASRAAPRLSASPVPPPVEGIEVPEDELVIPEEDEFEDDLVPDPSEEFLFGESMRQDEPLTAGADYGEGPSLIRVPTETREDFRRRLVQVLGRAEDETSKEFAARIARGE